MGFPMTNRGSSRSNDKAVGRTEHFGMADYSSFSLPWYCNQDRSTTMVIQAVMKGAAYLDDKVCHSQALWQLGASYIAVGGWREAETPLSTALVMMEDALGMTHLNVARICNSLAVVYYKVNSVSKSCVDMYSSKYPNSESLPIPDTEVS